MMPENHHQTGLACHTKRQKVQAHKAFSTALKNYPEHLEAKIARKELEQAHSNALIS